MGAVANWLSANGGGLLSTAANVGLGVWSQKQANKNIDKQLSAQSAENEKIRQYNLELAKKQNAWNLAQWNRENEYNSPSAQRARLEAAGLNPALMYGGVQGNVAASSPELTSGSPASPQDWSALGNKRTLGDAVSSGLDNQLKQAQIDNINADTEKKGAEVSILSSDAKFRDAINRGLIETQNVDIRVKSKGIEFTDQQIKESQERIRSIDALCQEVYARIDAIRNGIANDNARLDLEKAFNKAAIDKARAETNLTEEQAFRLSQELERVLRQYDDKHDIDRMNVIQLENADEKHRHEISRLIIDNEKASFEAKISGPYEGYDSTLSFADNYLKFLNRLLHPIASLIHK